MKNPYEYVKILPNVIPDNHLEELNTHALNNKTNTSLATVGSKNQSINIEYRNTHWISISDQMRENIHNALIGLYHHKIQDCYEKDIVNIEPVQMLYYPVGGKYDEHNDSEEIVDGNLKQTASRDVSVVCYLNEDYEGGELEFTFLGLKIKPRKGTVIFFPSYYEFTHRVHPVISGERFSLVSWIETNDRLYTR